MQRCPLWLLRGRSEAARGHVLSRLTHACRKGDSVVNGHLKSISFTAEESECVPAGGTSVDAAWDHAAYFDAQTGSRTFGRFMLHAAEVTSTQDILSEHWQLPEGVPLVADIQTKGRGRRSNQWESLRGCLMYSFNCALPATRSALLPHVQYLVSIVLVDAVNALAPAHVPPSPLQLKWPNDIYANGVKVGGIICNSTFRDGAFVITIGCGLNVTNAHPTTCLASVLHADHAACVTREALLGTFMSRYGAEWARFVRLGFAPFRARYLAQWMHSGQRLTVREEGAAAAGQGDKQVVVSGLAANGYLEARDPESGQTVELHPDGSLDLWGGLVIAR